MATDLRAVLIEFEIIYAKLDEAKAVLKDLQAAYDRMRYETVPDALREAGILDESGHGSCTTPSGKKVYMSTDLKAYIPQADAEEAHANLKRMGFGELIRPTVHPSTLTSWVRGRLENAEELPEGIIVFQQDRAALRRS